MAIQQAVSNTNQTLDQTADTALTGISITPGAGDYLAVFTGYWDFESATVRTYEFSIYVNNAIIQHTERRSRNESSITAAGVMFTVGTAAWITVGAGQTVEIRYRRTTGTTGGIMKRRTLTLFPKASADFQQATDVNDATVSATTNTLLTGMTLTPGAGTYLLVFSTSADNIASGISLFNSVYVNNVQLAHTEREFWAEASISANLGANPIMIACVVTPGAGQTVEIRSRRVTNDWTVAERTLTLMKVEAADIKEVSVVADTAGVTNTTYALVNGMSHTDPGTGDWLGIFSTSTRYGTIGADEHTDFTMFLAAVQDTNSERRLSQGASIDNADYVAFTAGRITVLAATDEVEIHWKGANAVSHLAKERTFVLVREAVATALPGDEGEFRPRSIPLEPMVSVW